MMFLVTNKEDTSVWLCSELQRKPMEKAEVIQTFYIFTSKVKISFFFSLYFTCNTCITFENMHCTFLAALGIWIGV